VPKIKAISMPAPADTPSTDAELSAALRARGQRVTSQRLILHRTLRELDRHATADELLRASEDRLPNLSLPTVYATLEVFEELGVVRRIAGGPGPVLWDPRPEEHQHFACRRCGRVLDLDVRVRAATALDAARVAGHAPDSAQLLVVGVCDRCRADV
jgi:Fe2+ or Zn2+ uptake regulation protein